MKKTVLIATALAAGMAANADKLYLNSIECTQHPFENEKDFSFKSVFSYDDFDKITQIETNQHIDSSHVIENVTVGQPPYYIFRFGYEQNTLVSASYSNILYATSLDASFKTVESADGKTVEADVSGFLRVPDIHYTLTAKYNDRGELVSINRTSDNVEIDKSEKYEYKYDDNNRISRMNISYGKDNLSTMWALSYGENGELTECLNGLPASEDFILMPGSYLKFDYDIAGSDTDIVSPEPICFIYDSLNINPKFENTYTLYIPEFIANILRAQKGLYVKSILQKSNTGAFTYECNYTLISDVDEIVSDAEVVPEYYNIQGMRVSNPSKGEIYIVKRGSKATKEVY